MNWPSSVITVIVIICILAPLLIGLGGFFVYQRLKRKKEGVVEKKSSDGKVVETTTVKTRDWNKWFKAFWPIWAIATILIVVTSFWPGIIQSYFNSQPLLFSMVLLGAIALVITYVLNSNKPADQTAKKKGFEFKFGTLIGWAAFVAVIYLFTSCANSVVKEMARPRVITTAMADEKNAETSIPEGFIILKPSSEWTHLRIFLGIRTDFEIQHPTAKVWRRIDNKEPQLVSGSTVSEQGINCRDIWIKSAENFPFSVKVYHK